MVYTPQVRRLLPFAALFFLTLVPLAHAEETDVWDFRSGTNMPKGAQSLTRVEVTAEGIEIETATDGYLYWDTPFLRPVDVLSLRVSNPKDIDAVLLWHSDKYPGQQVQRAIHIPGKPGIQVVNMVPGEDNAWMWNTDQLGLGFPAQTDIVLESMVWRRYSFTEKMQTAWRSFWTPDEFRAYSINFLWGPLLATNPVSLDTLFQTLPPPSWSVDRIFYAVMGIAILIGLLFYAFDRSTGKRIAWIIVGSTFLFCWLLFDARMGYEIMQYGMDDYRTFIAPPIAEKTFRTHEHLYSLAEEMLPTLQSYDSYVLFAPEGSPAYSVLRYQSYPSIPLRPDQERRDTKLWVILERPDIRMEKNHLVNQKGEILSTTGSVIRTFDTDTFLFATP